MSPAQVLVFGILWVSVVLLGGLVLLLYRQVERAYSMNPARQSGGLLRGVSLPDLEVVHEASVTLLPELRSNSRSLLLFVKQSCDRCGVALKLLESAQGEIQPIVIVLEGRTTELRSTLPPWFGVYEAAYPNEAARDFGVTSVPLAYITNRGRVMATGSPGNREELSSLIERADAAETAPDSAGPPASVSEGVFLGREG